MQWVNASIPVAAVTSGGSVRVSNGSTKAASGTRCALTTPFFSSSLSSRRIAIGETSLPVPAVVGRHTSGVDRERTFPTPKQTGSS